VPVIKISSNHALYTKKPKWIDFNGAEIVSRNRTEVVREVLDLVIAVTSGQKTRNEENLAEEIAIFKDGVTL